MAFFKSFLTYLLLVVSVVSLAQNKQEMSLQAFNKVNLQGIMSVELVKGSTNKVTAEAINGANIEDLTVSVAGGELSVKTKIFKQLTDKDQKKNNKANKEFKVKIEYNGDLTVLSAGRGADVVAKNIAANRLSIEASSGAIVESSISVNALEISSTQGAKVVLSGKASFQQAKVNTAGELEAFALNSEETEVKANTGGIAQVNASKSLDASAATGGVITYKGSPAQRNVKSTLGGEVNGN